MSTRPKSCLFKRLLLHHLLLATFATLGLSKIGLVVCVKETVRVRLESSGVIVFPTSALSSEIRARECKFLEFRKTLFIAGSGVIIRFSTSNFKCVDFYFTKGVVDDSKAKRAEALQKRNWVRSDGDRWKCDAQGTVKGNKCKFPKESSLAVQWRDGATKWTQKYNLPNPAACFGAPVKMLPEDRKKKSSCLPATKSTMEICSKERIEVQLDKLGHMIFPAIGKKFEVPARGCCLIPLSTVFFEALVNVGVNVRIGGSGVKCLSFYITRNMVLPSSQKERLAELKKTGWTQSKADQWSCRALQVLEKNKCRFSGENSLTMQWRDGKTKWYLYSNAPSISGCLKILVTPLPKSKASNEKICDTQKQPPMKPPRKPTRKPKPLKSPKSKKPTEDTFKLATVCKSGRNYNVGVMTKKGQLHVPIFSTSLDTARRYVACIKADRTNPNRERYLAFARTSCVPERTCTVRSGKCSCSRQPVRCVNNFYSRAIRDC